MKKIRLLILVFLISSLSCSHLKSGKEIKVQYEYDIRLYMIGGHWVNKEVLDDTIRYQEKSMPMDSIDFYINQIPIKQFTLIDSIDRYSGCYKKSEQKEFNLTFTDKFTKTNIKIYSVNKEIFNKDLTTNMSCGCSGGLKLDKKLPSKIKIKIGNHQAVALKLDYRFNYGYIWYDGDNIGITFTNYRRILD